MRKTLQTAQSRPRGAYPPPSCRAQPPNARPPKTAPSGQPRSTLHRQSKANPGDHKSLGFLSKRKCAGSSYRLQPAQVQPEPQRYCPATSRILEYGAQDAKDNKPHTAPDLNPAGDLRNAETAPESRRPTRLPSPHSCPGYRHSSTLCPTLRHESSMRKQ